ncbi:MULTISPECIES: PDR/VanB family oxidoreductase [Enemella]|uniref:Oxidoreductase n=1 Tax=Enemella dayhoffiae TaxID=2016507 RepID=A0A255GUY4_9ACTN|nr:MULTISPECIES: PDR/VanB family oxidoreductase [Enemella]OYO19272.1 oxidoreductase [Enemella dayhoffiae]TDO93308.1 vanillate O-demethylase ferredoxin subunit [Enemella evansiae]
MKLIDVKVAEIIDETPTVKSIRFVRADGLPLGVYQAGAHVDVVGPTAITRQYSLCSTPDDPESYTVAVKREDKSRGGSVALHELKVGDSLQISEPRNLLAVDLSASHHVLLAAGIGITPMLSMARWLDVHGHSFDLHYFARSHEDAAFLPLLQERCPEKLHTHLGLAPEEHEPALAASLSGLPDGSHVYLCGPGVFMDLVRRVAERFVPEEHIHQESFVADEQPDASENTAFEVEFEGDTYPIPADRSIVEVLQENGVDVDTSCQEGICGTCIMSVLEGTPEHRDNVLTKSEKAANETMAVCVSRAKTPKLVLDYF